jgi:hypothetical protein
MVNEGEVVAIEIKEGEVEDVLDCNSMGLFGLT